MKPRMKDWERADKLNVELVGYGYNEKRVIVRFHLPKDRDINRTQLVVAQMIRDVKHSKNWTCEFCGAPARETDVQNLSWQHLDPPRLVIYCHFVCDMDEQHVRRGLTATHQYLNMMNMMSGGGPVAPARNFDAWQRPPDVSYPLGGSCACCERDETAKDDASLKKCSKCKLTRYCGAECQKKDWPRHKVVCKMVHSVNFENWE
ncbi:hypothetical protein BN946_scf184844.g69 [Trametes cinnabarina]|uniref:MYND-type domain-containing protein n=1 Tax=Pycnoporus cinnabarinus TaxID=5643 RepID=A0A060S9N9_PYCCI|nr:hypothetical protein BN946_scf184844.g69 [Trametes cinnabarina]